LDGTSTGQPSKNFRLGRPRRTNPELRKKMLKKGGKKKRGNAAALAYGNKADANSRRRTCRDRRGARGREAREGGTSSHQLECGWIMNREKRFERGSGDYLTRRIQTKQILLRPY